MSKFRFAPRFVNRNPRNVERLRLQRRPDGWEFEKANDTRHFIYRVDFTPSASHITASIVHFQDGKVLEASTKERGIQAQLYSCTDVSAAYNIGRLLAQRCKMAGILSCTSGVSAEDIQKSERRTNFFKALEESGIKIGEPDHIPHSHLNDPDYVWEPFTIQHDRQDKLDELDLSLEPGKGVC